MDHYMPQIFWHDRKALLSVDIHKAVKNNKYRIATSSVQKEVRLWEFEFENDVNQPVAPLSVSFLANLSGHNSAVNQVKFSPNADEPMLASGDCDGRISVWKLNDAPPPPPQDELPPNKENWVRFKILNHDSDVSSLCWSPEGTQIASVSNDDCLCVHNALTGKRVFAIRNFRHFPNGVNWDPLGKYIVTMSADRKMDIVDAVKGTRLKSFSAAEIPVHTLKSSLDEKQEMFKLFHDDQLFSFQRGVAFSPNGELIVAPCAHLELGSADLFGSYVFKRSDLTRDSPAAFFPTLKPTFLIKFSPLVFELSEAETNFIGLPYRLVWAALTKDAVYFYDSQHEHPIGVVDNIHYNALTDASWSDDGNVLVVSSLEGYCSFIKFKLDHWGATRIEAVPCPASPQLVDEKKRKKKIVVNENEPTPKASTPRQQPTTPKSPGVSLIRYFNKAEVDKSTDESDVAKKKKRIQLVTLED